MDGTFIKSASIALQRERGGGSQEKWREPKRTSAISCSGDQQRIHYQQGGQAEENGQRPNQKFLTSGRYTRRPTNESTWLRDVKSHRHFARPDIGTKKSKNVCRLTTASSIGRFVSQLTDQRRKRTGRHGKQVHLCSPIVGCPRLRCQIDTGPNIRKFPCAESMPLIGSVFSQRFRFRHKT